MFDRNDFPGSDASPFNTAGVQAEFSSMAKPANDGLECSRCYLPIDARAIVCGHCQFQVQAYRENLSKRRTETMRIAPVSSWLAIRPAGDSAWGDLKMALGVGFFGVMFALVPILGPLVTYSSWVVALGFILSACGLPIRRWLLNLSSTGREAERQRRENTYTDVCCPACRAVRADWQKRTVLMWPNAKNGLAPCPLCRKVCYRFANKLLWVPFDKVTLTGTLEEYLQ